MLQLRAGRRRILLCSGWTGFFLSSGFLVRGIGGGGFFSLGWVGGVPTVKRSLLLGGSVAQERSN